MSKPNLEKVTEVVSTNTIMLCVDGEKLGGVTSLKETISDDGKSRIEIDRIVYDDYSLVGYIVLNGKIDFNITTGDYTTEHRDLKLIKSSRSFSAEDYIFIETLLLEN
jgi:hypothetical protein